VGPTCKQISIPVSSSAARSPLVAETGPTMWNRARQTASPAQAAEAVAQCQSAAYHSDFAQSETEPTEYLTIRQGAGHRTTAQDCLVALHRGRPSVICTFYSYKGGVGRSMALAKSADILARAGLRVLMIDFDLEAPGLEQYFDIDQKSIRAHTGLFDLISSYKAAMANSLLAAPEDQKFRKLDELFIAPVYLRLPSGGKLPCHMRQDSAAG
jgi:Mrp family chromosome partitioning ATPase